MIWYILCPSKGRSYLLTPDKDQFQVGRTAGDIILVGDQSVSRKHALIEIKSDEMGEKIVTIKDLGSKYGTYVNDNKLDPNRSHRLSDGHTITFGCQWNEWRCFSEQLMVTSSNMSNEDKVKLRHIVTGLGGMVVGDWQGPCTHLTMAEILLTAKVVCALASGIPIVTPDYWVKFKEAFDEQKELPNYEEFIPPLKETVLNKNKVSFAINEKRRTLFLGKRFIFSSDKQLKKYKTIVETAGGSCEILSNGRRMEEFCHPMMVVMQHVSNSDSQPPPLYDAVLLVMRKKGLKPIPESEIGLAILMCSLDTYCNMQYNVVGSVLEGGAVMSQVKRAEVLAEDSQMSVIDSVSVKTEEPDIKTEKEADITTTPLSIMASFSFSSNGSSNQWQNQETLPCGINDTHSKDKSFTDSSPDVAPGPSRKRPASVEIGEPPPKRCLKEVTSAEMKKENGLMKEIGFGRNPTDRSKSDSVIADSRESVKSSTSKRKLDEANGSLLEKAHPKKPMKAKTGCLPDIDEDPIAMTGDIAALFEEDDLEEWGETIMERKAGGPESNGVLLTRRKVPQLLSTLTQSISETPSTSKCDPTLNEDDKDWIMDGERGLKAAMNSDWGGMFKGLDGKRFGKLVDVSVGVGVKMAKLVVSDRPIQRGMAAIQDSSTVNFKKFRKVWPAGSGNALPVIFGESDLVPHRGCD